MSAYGPRHAVQQPDPCHQADDAWQELIAAYLEQEWRMPVHDVYAVLARCEADKDARWEYLRLLAAESGAITPSQPQRRAR